MEIISGLSDLEIKQVFESLSGDEIKFILQEAVFKGCRVGIYEIVCFSLFLGVVGGVAKLVEREVSNAIGQLNKYPTITKQPVRELGNALPSDEENKNLYAIMDGSTVTFSGDFDALYKSKKDTKNSMKLKAAIRCVMRSKDYFVKNASENGGQISIDIPDGWYYDDSVHSYLKK